MHTCISSHGLKRSWRSCPRRVNAGNKNTPSTHHPRRQNVTTLMVGLKKRSHTQKSHPKVVNPRDVAGERKKKKKKYIYIYIGSSHKKNLVLAYILTLRLQTDFFQTWLLLNCVAWYQFEWLCSVHTWPSRCRLRLVRRLWAGRSCSTRSGLHPPLYRRPGKEKTRRQPNQGNKGSSSERVQWSSKRGDKKA